MKEAIRHAFEVTIGLDCLIKPAEEFTYEELNDHLQEKADDFQDGLEFGYNKAKEEMQEQGLALQSDMDKTIKQNIALKAQIEKMKRLLEKWYNQHSDKTYTQTFYDELIKATEGFLWSDVCVK